MSSWQSVFAHHFHNIEEEFDRLKYRLLDRLGERDPILITPYRGFGSAHRLYLKGRVLENKGITAAEDNDNLWENLVNTFRRFESDEIPYARLSARIGSKEIEVTANEEGFFEIDLPLEQPLVTNTMWQPIDLELLEPPSPDGQPVRAQAQVFVAPPSAEYAVISDIDDTVLQTDATHFIKMARNVFLGNSRSRLPFKGVGAFYRALFKGGSGQAQNPLFYVSSSPWNLYDLLSDFFQLQDIPIGPILFLRDWGITEEEFLPLGHKEYKLDTIRKIIDFYPAMSFILLGDSGQEDPEIYYELVKEYPNRIKAVYIRNVSRDLKRPESIRKLAKEVVAAGSVLILADSTVPLAEHAAEQGWIRPETLIDIRVEKAADEVPAGTLETMVGTAPEKEQTPPTVVVQAETPTETKQAVQGGAIEEALDSQSEQTKKPPTIIVEGEEGEKP